MKENKNLISAIIASLLVICLGFFVYRNGVKKDTVLSNDNANTTVLPSEIDTKSTVDVSAPAKIQTVNELVAIFYNHRNSGDYKTAESALKNALQQEPKNPVLMQLYALLYSKQGRYVEANTWIDKALTLASGDETYWETKIEIVKNLYKNKTQIVAVYEEAIIKSKLKINIVTSYAVYLESVGDIFNAVVEWQKAIELVPENKAIYQAEIDRLKNKI